MAWPMKWFEGVVSMDGQLKGKERSHRRLLFVVAACVFLLSPYTGCFGIHAEHVTSFLIASYSILLTTTSTIILQCLCRIYITKRMVQVYIVVCTFAICCLHLHNQGISYTPRWSLFVLMLDLSLVMRLGGNFAKCLLCGIVLCIVLLLLDLQFRFGLLDLPGSASKEYRSEKLAEWCDCSNPPCASTFAWTITEAWVVSLVLVIDFIATRGFAEEAEKEHAAMTRTIETVEAAAQLLAGYDVDTVAELLEAAEGSLPLAMHAALQCLEKNLRLYQPYLPKSCLPFQGSSDDDSVCSTPRSESLTTVTTPLSPHRERVMKPTKASVFVMNVCGSLGLLESNAIDFTNVFDAVLTTALHVAHHRHGLVDVFVGDRVLVSFNTWRPCAVHATSAVKAAQDIVQAVGSMACGPQGVRVSIGLATGRVLHGDVGCAEMRRFSVLGGVPLVACGMERAARAFGLPVVCNRNVQQEAELEHVLLLVPRLVHLVKAGACGGDKLHDAVPDGGEQPVYEVQVPDAADKTDVTEGEWLYQVGRGAAEWAPYNDAVRKYVKGACVADAVSDAGQHEAAVRHIIAQLGCRHALLVHV